MDTHKKQHNVAVLDRDTGEIQQFVVKNTGKDIAKMVKTVVRQAPSAVKFCYEAGLCGFTLQRRIEAMGHQCSVIAPSLVPVKPGDRIKTDRRDAKKLLGHFAAGQLTEVYPPNPQQKTDRELTRCRGVAQENLKRIRHQLVKFLTRHGYIYSAGRHWTGNKRIRRLLVESGWHYRHRPTVGKELRRRLHQSIPQQLCNIEKR